MAATCADSVSWLSTMLPRLRAIYETFIRADATGTFETLTFASCCGEPNHIT